MKTTKTTGFSGVGFIGLGAMGKPMAEQLATKLPAHTKLYVYDVTEASINELVEKFPSEVMACQSAGAVAESSQIIISMVPEGAHVPHLDQLLDISTSLAIKQHTTDHHPKASFYDAPMSEGTLAAQKGTIAFFLGCDTTDPNNTLLMNLLGLMGKQVIPCGKPSLGLASKLCNNYLSGLIAIASAETLSTGIKAGLDPRVLSQVFAAGTAQNAICDKFNPCPGVVPDAPSSKGYQGRFKVQLMKKDFSLAVNLAESVGATLALDKQGLQTCEAASNDPRCRDLDSRVVFRYLGRYEDWAEKQKES